MDLGGFSQGLTDKKYQSIYYFIFLCAIAFFLNDMFITMQNQGYINFKIIDEVDPVLKEIWHILITFCFGMFYGANFITLLDIKKRLQGILILGASSITIYAFNYIVTIRPDIFFYGLIISATISYFKYEIKGKYREYPVATLIISFLVLFTVWLSFINYILGAMVASITGSNIYTILWYLILTILFTWVFYKFSREDIIKSRVFVVGPRQSGKTVFMCGCYDKVDKSKKIIGLPSRDLEEAVRQLWKGWIPGTVVPKNYQFRYLHGILFVNEVEMNTLDVRGEFLEQRINDIILYIKDKNKNKDKNKEKNKNKNNTKNINIIDPEIKNVGDEIYSADKLIFIIDGYRIGKDEDYITNCHTEIMRTLPNKPYCIVVTKSDKFYDFNSGLSEEGYENLKKTVLAELTNTGNLNFLQSGCYLDTIPVFFMESRGKPAVEKGRFVTLGFDKILDVIS